ncbi:MAG: hypothetical protein PVH93_02280 [Nitrosopumilaceae archaeon]
MSELVCNHESIMYDDFTAFNVDNKGRCTGYVCLSHCKDCSHKFKKVFKKVSENSDMKTFVLERNEYE